MPSLRIAHNLPFTTAVLRANNQILQLNNVLVDTGSAASIFKTEDLARIGIELQPNDPIRFMVGIGGSESVIEKRIDAIIVADLVASPFIIQMGVLDYQLPMDGILGTDFLLRTDAKIDFSTLSIT